MTIVFVLMYISVSQIWFGENDVYVYSFVGYLELHC